MQTHPLLISSLLVLEPILGINKCLFALTFSTLTHNANLHILHPKKRALIKDWLLNGITSTEIAADRLSGHLMEKRLYLFPKRICVSLLLLLGMGPLLDLTSDRVYNAGYEMAQTTIGIGSPEGTTADPRGTAGYKAAETSSGGSDDMKVIIIGAGEVGYHIADILSREGSDTVVIDKNEERLHEISEALDIQAIVGSGSSPEVLRRADMANADMVVAVTDSDETNMIACLLASTQSRIPIRIARIRNPELDENNPLFQREHLNIDLCINPEREAVNHLMDRLEFPGASEVLGFAGGLVRLLGFAIDPKAAVVGKRLIDLRAMTPPGFKILITSMVRDEKFLVPTAGTEIMAEDYIFAVIDAARVRELLHFFGKETEPPRRVMIIGGGNTGLMLAQHIEKRGISTKIIDKRRDRCEQLASFLEKTIVLQGDGTSQELLREEHIEDTDFFIAVTNDEEANILGALLAKQLGAKNVISLIRKIDYIPLVTRFGIDGVINPRHAAISRILHFIRKGKIISATPIRDEKAEVFEFIAMETSDITNHPFKEIRFPKGTIVGAIVRGKEIIIPDGDSVILAGDHVVIFTPHSAIPQLQNLLTVKLEYFG